MKIKQNQDGTTVIIASVYQAKNGGIYINWGRKDYPLPEELADDLAWELQDFKHKKYLDFYNTN